MLVRLGPWARCRCHATGSTADMPVPHRDETRRHHLIDVLFRRSCFAERCRFVKQCPLLLSIEPFHEHKHVAASLVHDVSRLKRGWRCQPMANVRESSGRIAPGCFPASADESGTIYSHRIIAYRAVIQSPLFQSKNVTGSFARFETFVIARNGIAAAPLVGDAYIFSACLPALV